MKNVPPSRCVSCNHKLDAATSFDDSMAPTPGSVTICLYCGHIMAFDNDLTLRNLTDSEMVEVAGDPRILAIQRAREKRK